ncbi:MAG: hypothetical protein P8J45_14610 [Phycisphaerales bacterium]|jgi:hypothetical protein|nr:hypothetical protein [Phycisphaerales bacterium]
MNDTRTSNKEGTRHCRKCNYELTGLPTEGQCPECGGTFGRVLVITGMQRANDSLKVDLFNFIMLVSLAIAIEVGLMLSRGTWEWTCCGTPLLIIATGVFASRLLSARSRRELGYDLRWIVDDSGIQVIRGMKNTIPLLKWSGIRTVRIRRGFGPFSRSFRRLSIGRRFHSVDLLRSRGQHIWIKGMNKAECRQLREKVLSYRNKSSD